MKPGEYVWLLQSEVKGSVNYYWMCRKVSLGQIDDINITHHERQANVIDMYRDFYKEGGGEPVKDIEPLVNFETPVSTNIDKGNDFDEIAKTSIAYKEEFTQQEKTKVP